MSIFVVVIDNSATIRKILETCLQREGYEVKCFPDGIEALRWLIAPEASIPSLVFTAMIMPGMNGIEVTRFLKRCAKLNTISVVLTSSRIGAIDRVFARLAGASSLLARPISQAAIIKAVQKYAGAAVHDASGSTPPEGLWKRYK